MCFWELHICGVNCLQCAGTLKSSSLGTHCLYASLFSLFFFSSLMERFAFKFFQVVGHFLTERPNSFVQEELLCSTACTRFKLSHSTPVWCILLDVRWVMPSMKSTYQNYLLLFTHQVSSSCVKHLFIALLFLNFFFFLIEQFVEALGYFA